MLQLEELDLTWVYIRVKNDDLGKYDTKDVTDISPLELVDWLKQNKAGEENLQWILWLVCHLALKVREIWLISWLTKNESHNDLTEAEFNTMRKEELAKLKQIGEEESK